MLAMFATDYKAVELVYAYNEFELKIKIDIPENQYWKDILNHYGQCYISNKYVYIQYDNKFKRIPFKNITYIKRDEMEHDVIYDPMLNQMSNHAIFYEMLVTEYNVDHHVFFENTAYTLKE